MIVAKKRLFGRSRRRLLKSVAAGLFLLLWIPWGMARAEGWTVELRESGLYPGGVARVDVFPGEAVSSARLSWKGASISLVPIQGGLSALFGIPRGENPGIKKVEITVTDGKGKVVKRILPFSVLPKEFPVQRLTLPESQVTLNKAALARHGREQDALRKAFSGLRPDPLWQEGFVLPLKGKVLSPFGFQRILNDKPRSPHSGVDFRASAGTPVAASGGGVVILADEHFFSGKSLYIDHGMGIVTMYFHLSEFKVKQGDRVKTGQIIGLVGSTGRSTGPHLHWGARVHDVKIDPLVLPDVTKKDGW
jgi:murein DD-endopeptidase MepM/ murein hydrolase activator NlpD